MPCAARSRASWEERLIVRETSIAIVPIPHSVANDQIGSTSNTTQKQNCASVLLPRDAVDARL